MQFLDDRLPANFWDKVVPVPHVGCWLWMAGLNENGYGVFRGRLAHRRSFRVLVGPHAPGLELDHLCRTRSCVNPDHLEPVTHEENMRRARGSHCRNGHEFTEENTYWPPGNRRRCLACKRASGRRYTERNSTGGVGWAAENAAKTHCVNGHEFTPENTIVRKNGGRKCRICQRVAAREWARRDRASKRRSQS